METRTDTILKSVLAFLISTVVCAAIASGIILICQILDLFIKWNDWAIFVIFALYGVLAAIGCEIAARTYGMKSKDRQRKRWAYIWRVTYAGFLYMDLFMCIVGFILVHI